MLAAFIAASPALERETPEFAFAHPGKTLLFFTLSCSEITANSSWLAEFHLILS